MQYYHTSVVNAMCIFKFFDLMVTVISVCKV